MVAIAGAGDPPLPTPDSARGGRVVDAEGSWVTPGFVDLHTHYDAEVEVSPQLFESLRHGVTTVLLGSCSLGAGLGTPEDIADIFCRVEGVPREHMLPMLEARKDWNTLPEYLTHLEGLALGPNVASYVPHSNLRVAALGFERSVDAGVTPSRQEQAQMLAWLEEALDCGYVGLSAQTLPWDKLGGTRERSKPLPGTFARWSELRALAKVLRRRGRVFQGVPNLVTKLSVLLLRLARPEIASSEHDDRRVGHDRVTALLEQKTEAVQDRHLQVEEHQVGLELLHHHQPLSSVAGEEDIDAALLQVSGEQLAGTGVVVDDEDGGRAAAHPRPASAGNRPRRAQRRAGCRPKP